MTHCLNRYKQEILLIDPCIDILHEGLGGLLFCKKLFAYLNSNSIKIIPFLIFTLFSNLSFARNITEKGYIELEPGRFFWVERDTVNPDAPTIILLNGMTYTTESWGLDYKAILSKGINTVRYDMWGQGRTLIKNPKPEQPITYLQQVEDLKTLIRVLNLKKDIHLVGLSYGGGIAGALALNDPEFTKEYLKSIVLISPFTEPLQAQEDKIQKEIRLWTRWSLLTPHYLGLNELEKEVFKENLYNTILRRMVMYEFFWAEPYDIALPNITYTPQRLEAIYQMTLGLKGLNLGTMAKDIHGGTPLTLVASIMDLYIPHHSEGPLMKFWYSLDISQRHSLWLFNGTEHKITRQIPQTISEMLDMIVKSTTRPDLIPQGTEFSVSMPFKIIKSASPKDQKDQTKQNNQCLNYLN